MIYTWFVETGRAPSQMLSPYYKTDFSAISPWSYRKMDPINGTIALEEKFIEGLLLLFRDIQ